MSYVDTLFSLRGKVAIVTGGARGNGEAISKALSLAGAKVVVADILEENASLAKDAEYDYCICDITSDRELNSLVSYTIEKYGRIDILVNNAGVSYSQKFEEYSEKNWESTHNINLKAPFKLSQLVAKHMKEQRSGTIINISSLNAEMAFPDNPAYMSSKGALRQLTRSTAYDLGKYGIRSNNVVPGYIRTDMTKKSWNDLKKRKERSDRTILEKWGAPEDLAGAVIFLSSDASGYITGQDIVVDGGWSIKGI
jgi:NAD(P)-dependent dehydrogenase (short-subunit alcohol dehydrogenase family)